MGKICFVILHYKAVQDTIACMDSIRALPRGREYDIVVVDNDSRDGSLLVLKERYGNQPGLHYVETHKNLGFAGGNNAGYVYARENLRPDYIVVLNNDTEMTDSQFAVTLESLYEEEKYDVLGPDIVNLEGEHQNPHREQVLTARELKKMTGRKRIWQIYLYGKKLLRLENKIRILENWDSRHTALLKQNQNFEQQRENVVLQGSCFIFSPLYIRANRQAFCPDTFLYLEEEILSWQCVQKGYKVLYSPKLHILHKEMGSTKQIMTGDTDRRIFYHKYFLKSAKVLRRLMKEGTK